MFLLARNGDPVCDLLYSNNWVPLGLMQAYFVTEDAYFYDLFCRHAAFLSTAQIHSQDPGSTAPGHGALTRSKWRSAVCPTMWAGALGR